MKPKKRGNRIVVVILFIFVVLGVFLVVNYFHYKTIGYPRFLYYTNLLYWQKGDHSTHIYVYNPNRNEEKEVLVLPTTVYKTLRTKDDIQISPDRTKIAYVLTEETEPGMGSSKMVMSDLYVANCDGTNVRLVHSSDKGNWIPFIVWSRDSAAIQYMTYYPTSKDSEVVNLQDNTIRVIDAIDYKTGDQQGGYKNLFVRSKRLLSFELPFLPKDKGILSLEPNNDFGMRLVATDVMSKKRNIIVQLTDRDGYLGPISLDGNYFLYRPGNDATGQQIQRGIELYYMNGNLIAQAPFRYFSEFIGFID